MNPQNFRRWLERAARQRREELRSQAQYEEWNAEPYRHGTRLMVERLCAEFTAKWRKAR